LSIHFSFFLKYYINIYIKFTLIGLKSVTKIPYRQYYELRIRFLLMNGFLILTAFTVSIDSFLCGLSLSFVKGKKSLMVLIVATTVFAMCLLTNYTAKLLSGILSERTACLGGLILIAVGVFNLLKKEDDEKIIDNGLIKESFIFFARSM